MAVHEITTLEQINRYLLSKDIVVIDFYASWCNPCKTVAPQFKKLASEFPSVAFLKIDIDEAHEKVMSTYFLETEEVSIPFFVIFNKGKITRLSGFDSKTTMDAIKKAMM